MRVAVSKIAMVDDDVAEEMFSAFADWLDDKGLLREGSESNLEFAFNRELGQMFIRHWKQATA